MADFDQLNITETEKKVLEGLSDTNLLFSTMLKRHQNGEFINKKYEPSFILEKIKDIREDILKKINLGIGSKIYRSELVIIEKEIGKRYDEIMELNEPEEEKGDNTSGPGATGTAILDDVMYGHSVEGSKRKRF